MATASDTDQKTKPTKIRDRASGEEVALDTIRDFYPALTEDQKQALRTWNEFEEFISLPFLPKSSAAVAKTRFTILRLGDAEVPSVDDPQKYVEQWVLLVMLDEPATLSLKNNPAEVRQFTTGDKALVSLPKGDGLRNKSALTISTILGQHGSMPGMYLAQLESRDRVKAGPIVLRSALEVR